MDERLTGMCVYCGAQPDTRDHVPSKVLLDEPYPPQLPIVAACESCNAGFSLDEQYLSCLLECVVCATTEPSGLRRSNVKRILIANPALQHRIQESQRRDKAGDLLWQPEIDRVRKIAAKLARGHAAYEIYPKLEEPDKIAFAPLLTISDHGRATFENSTSGRLEGWPEIGSRSFLRAYGKKPDQFKQMGNWIVVQPDRYRYAVVEAAGGMLVRIVLSEYLACEVTWA